jgi:subtilisin-like proprotein convertase family protein
MKKTLLTVLVLFSITLFYGQKENNAWKEVAKPGVESSEKYRRSTLPTEYKLYSFDYTKFVAQLTNIPNRDTFTGTSNTIISIPNPNGEMVRYRIIEASTFEESLQAQFPEIRSFAGNAVNDASTVIRFSVSPNNGLSAIIRTAAGESTYIIDPITMDNKTFIVFDRSKSKKADGSFNCTTEEDITTFGPNLNKGIVNQMLNNADDGKLRKFQMAQSCTAEYSNYFGATSAAQVNLVLAAFNATYTRCNAIFEMDFNCTMELIANTTSVIYYNPSTDPYSPPANLGNWNAELGATLQSVIGNANYDIGHVFGDSGGGGNAGCIGCICSTDNSKGTGYTSPSDGNPQGDFFDVDYVAHEIGHQLGGNHTFSHSAENNAVNMEPGSGVTIMGYAGITGATDVAAHSIPIFHAGSIQQITNNIKTKDCAGPNTGYCLEIVNTGNAVPAPTAPATKTLPIGTAFKLTGTATDANASDVLSYCWEQVNDATTVGAAASYPSGTKTNGPNFRSFMPKNNGTRNFPRLEDHVANGIAGNTWEIIPTINRTLAFRMTVRDNKAGGGNNESANTAVTFNTLYGPFLVTSQNTAGISYTQGSTQTITWSVNNTTALAGSTNVNIKLSTDGGQTYTTTLVANTPNDGTQTVTIPNVSAPFCRILIEPTGNDYYAINTNNFAIGYTVASVCNDYTRTLTSGNTITTQSPLAYQNFLLNIPANVIITDVNVSSNITHSRRNELYAAVQSGAGTFVALFQTGGCNNAASDLTGTWDDQSATPAGSCNFGTGTMKPVSSLAILNGENAAGNWYFRAADVTASRDGVLNSFTFRICYNQITETPNACGVITTTWNGSTWSNGIPLKNVVAIFNGNYTSTGDIEACSVIINTGVNITIATGHTLIVGNEVTVNGTGSLTINNNAALRQINGASINTGNIIVKRNSAPMIRQDYTAWASPVSGQQLQSFSPNTLPTRFYQYLYTGTTTPTAYQAVTSTTNFVIGKGYMIRSADNSSATIPVAHNGQFTGVPFNGNLSANLGKGYNLLGNPYASPIDAARFLSDNSTTVGALYFWTHTVAASGGVYPINNFASYTTMGGTASAAGGAIPNGKIQTGQGFYVKAYDFGTANFSNFQRLNASTSTQFFRNSNIEETTPVTEKHRIWLNLNDDNNSYNQILLGYMDGATNGFDQGIDGRVLDDSKSMIYNLLNDEELVIQGKAMPFTDEDIVTLGLKAITAGTYNISLETLDGLFTTQDVFLKDNYTNIIHDIKQSAYVFATQDGTFTDRFEVVYRNSALSNDDFTNENTVLVASQNNQLTITSLKETIKEVTVFDVLGRNLYHNTNVNEKAIAISTLQATSQALFVKVTLTTGETIMKKMVF